MLNAPRVLKLGGFALAVLALVSAITLPMTTAAQEPTRTPTAQVTDGPTATAEATEATEATEASEPTRLPPCPLPAGEAVPTESATEGATEAATVAATEAATEIATQEGTAAATELPAFEPGYLGIAGEDADSCGTRVVDVIPDSPAEEAGVQVGDIVVGVGVTGYTGVLLLRDYIITQPVGAELELVLRRDGEELIVPVVLAARPAVVPPTVTPSS